MREYKRRLYVFSFMFNGEKTFHDVKMLSKYSREETLEPSNKKEKTA